METRIFVKQETYRNLRHENRFLRKFTRAIFSVSLILMVTMTVTIIHYAQKVDSLESEIKTLKTSAAANKSWSEWLHGVPADDTSYESIGTLEDSDTIAEPINLTPNESMKSEESEEGLQEESIPELINAVYSAVNMDASLQAYVIRRANETGYPEQILFGMAKKESTYNAKATHVNSNGTTDSGMWQINSCNYAALAEHFDMSVNQVKDQIFDPYFNLECALFLLKDCERYHPDNWHTLLMCYNMGGGNAKNLWSQGIYSSSYSRAVVRYATELGWADNNKI